MQRKWENLNFLLQLLNCILADFINTLHMQVIDILSLTQLYEYTERVATQSSLQPDMLADSGNTHQCAPGRDGPPHTTVLICCSSC